MYKRMTVTLEGKEMEVLSKLAIQERRDPRQQAALLIRQGLERSGLLGPRNSYLEIEKEKTDEICS